MSMNTRNRNVRQLLLVVVGSLLLASCGSGGSGGTNTASNASPAQPVTSSNYSRTVSGAAAKGPLRNALVTFYEIDDLGFPLNNIATTTTDSTGGFSINIPNGSGSVLVETSGGSFVDESDQQQDPGLKRQISLLDGQGFLSVLPEGATEVAITPYTHALVIQARRDALAGNFSQVFDGANTRLSTETGFDVVTTIPADPVSPAGTASDAQRQYALLLGTVANIVNNVSIQLGEASPTYAIILSVIEDLSDGRLDGSSFNDPVDVVVDGVPQPLPDNVDFDAELNRFRNNNFNAYENTQPPSIDGDALFNTRIGADAGLDQVVRQSSTVNLDATASLSGGGTIGFNWQQSAGPQVTLNGSATSSPSFTAPLRLAAPETLVFTVTVSDATGRSSSDDVQIDITPALPPISFVVDELSEPEDGGIDLAGGSRVTLNADGTGNLLEDFEVIPFSWTEIGGVLTFDFTAIGGLIDDFIDRSPPDAEGNFIEFQRTEITDRLELTLVDDNPAKIVTSLREVGLEKTFNISLGVQEPDRAIDKISSAVFYDLSTPIPFPAALGTRLLPTGNIGIDGEIDNDLFLDELNFNANGSGTARNRNATFSWSLAEDGHAIVTFAGGDVAHYYHLSTRDSGQVIGTVYTRADGLSTSDVFISFVHDGSVWDPGNTAGVFTVRRTFELGDGTVVDRDGTFRLHPNGTGLLERVFIDPETGDRRLDLARVGLCWQIDGGRDLVVNGIVTGSFPISVNSCNAVTNEITLFRFTNRLFEQTGNTYKYLLQDDVNTCEQVFPGSGCNDVIVTDYRPVIATRIALNSNPPFAARDFVTADSPDGPNVFNVVDNDLSFDAAIDPTTVRVIQDPINGSVTVNNATGDLTYLPSGGGNADTFFYRVSDANGVESNFAQVDIDFAAAAVAGPDQEVVGGSVVTLDASDSVVINGPLTFSWVQTFGPIISLSNPNSATPTFSAGVSSVIPIGYGFELTVTDAAGGGSTDQVDIQVIPNFRHVSYSVQKDPLPFQFGLDISNGDRIILQEDNTGSFAGSAGETEFLWSEQGATLIFDFSPAGGHVVSENVFFQDIDNDGLQEEVNFVFAYDRLELTLINDTPGMDLVSFLEFTRSIQTNVTDGVLVTDESGTSMSQRTLYSPEAALPFSGVGGQTRTLLVSHGNNIPTLQNGNQLSPDELSFENGGTGSALNKGQTFNWSLNDEMNLDVFFSGGDSVRYFKFESRTMGDTVVADYMTATGNNQVDVVQSFVRDPGAAWNAATVAGTYVGTGFFSNEIGQQVSSNIQYRVHPNGVGVLEIEEIITSTGFRSVTRSSRAICWMTDDALDLVFNRTPVSGQNFPGNVPDASYCSAHSADSDIAFRRTNRLFNIQGTTLQTLAVEDQNNGVDFPFPNGQLERSNFFPRILERTPYVGAPPVISDSSATVNFSGVISNSSDLLLNVFDPDGTVNPGSVVIVGDPLFGNVTVNPATGDITYTHAVFGQNSDSVSYRVRDNDGNLSTFGTIAVTISP